MKRANHLFPQILKLENLRWAYWKASKGKRYSKAVIRYAQELDRNLIKLRDQIREGNPDLGNYYYFTIHDPKEREICASSFPEQILHHAIMNFCHPFFEQKQIYDSYACRKGKGTYAALNRAKSFTKKYDWYLKLDVRKYFASINHEVLLDQLTRMFKDKKLLDLFQKIIRSYQAKEGSGLPIGNLCSQYFANHYLSGLDHFVKEKLGVKGYIRYMDDMMFWGDTKRELQEVNRKLHEYVPGMLRCELKPTILNPCKYGISGLGYRVFPHYVRLTQRSKKRFIKKYRYLDDKYREGSWSEESCQRRILPLLAFILHADTQKFRESLILHPKGSSS